LPAAFGRFFVEESMSDETTLAEAPVAETVADPTTKIEAPALAEATPDPKPEAEPAGEPKPEEGTEGDTEAKKKVPGSQRLKRRLELIEADYLQLQRETETLRREREAAVPKPDGKPGVDREPTEADYPSDWFAFQEAKTAWTARQAIRDEFNRARDEQAKSSGERVQVERHRERLEAYHEYAEEVRERIPDFDKVVSTASGVTVKPELADEILSSEKSALLQYHLAKNPEKVRELNALSGRELAREIGRLEARVHLPTAKRATEANAPPSEVKGAAAPPVDQNAGPDDMNAYVAWRRKQTAS
jgi:hypothetical protein